MKYNLLIVWCAVLWNIWCINLIFNFLLEMFDLLALNYWLGFDFSVKRCKLFFDIEIWNLFCWSTLKKLLMGKSLREFNWYQVPNSFLLLLFFLLFSSFCVSFWRKCVLFCLRHNSLVGGWVDGAKLGEIIFEVAFIFLYVHLFLDNLNSLIYTPF